MQKTAVVTLCKSTIQERIDNYKNRIKELKNSLEDEDNGNESEDDDGTSEIMAEFERTVKLKEEQEMLKNELLNANAGAIKEMVENGSLVVTNDLTFFIGISLGELKLEDGSKIFAISTKAPIFQSMRDLKPGDSFTFNDMKRTIVSVA